MHSAEDRAQPSGSSYQPHQDEQVISDPVRIRALAHPLRLRLLDHLQEVVQATATQCAAALDESVASCSFHLRTLAKHGYVEPAPRAGRDKPWKLNSRRRKHTIDNTRPGSIEAVSALAALQVEEQMARIQDWLTAAPSQPAEDIDAAVISSGRFYATPDEVRQLREQILHLADGYVQRWTNPQLRPPGSKPTKVFAVLNFEPQDPA
ncbi:winged helix-turn-helix domain-containing protein [Arthrobacter castelli]|uniref:winged helix-turn-helix domain-containing protein n=1 Tax=Arthrobacter castelli TaxID=271431 RepID=UPI000560AFFF|nr:helix-turn-helix domain-containing protein [Arthrobacter castelli]